MKIYKRNPSKGHFEGFLYGNSKAHKATATKKERICQQS